MPSCEVHVCASATPATLRRVELLASSLRRRGGAWHDARIVVSVLPNRGPLARRAAARRLEREGVEMRPTPRTLWRRHGIHGGLMARYRQPFEAPFVLFLDADVLCTGRLDELSSLVADGALAGLVAHVSPLALDMVDPQPRTFWRRLYASAGLDDPQLVCEHSAWGVMDDHPERRWCPPYFNDGVLAMRRDVAAAIGEVIVDELRAVERIMTSWYALQLATSLAIARQGVRWRTLPMRFNMANQQSLWDRFPAEADDVRLLHYLRLGGVDREADFADPVAFAAMLGRSGLSCADRRLQAELRSAAE